MQYIIYYNIYIEKSTVNIVNGNVKRVIVNPSQLRMISTRYYDNQSQSIMIMLCMYVQCVMYMCVLYRKAVVEKKHVTLATIFGH